MTERPEALEVWASIGGQTRHAGTATFSYRRSPTTTTFAYTPEFLASTDAYPLDPRLPLSLTPAHTAGLPAAFDDSTPDWWGQKLIERQRRLAATGSATGRPAP
ncbi:HipA N-terminal domain-containing protein [Nocardioides sp.]|uniref:HipA N-terminal domain-containing protein n=1 Tax=Nocardioides sp. TaxID=35761 RepID=UPI00262E1B5E|nr:HipA N-terminal domain-containing protein [Nocardioides sp.]